MRQFALDTLSSVFRVELEPRTEPWRVANLISQLRPIEIQGGLMRIGGSRDGAYLIPESLAKKIDGCVSPGVGSTISFEKHLYRLLGIKTLLVDPAGEEILREHAEFTHIKKLLVGTKSINSNATTLSDLVSENFAEESNLILQIDIEGSEYGALLSASEQLLNKFLVIVIEFHDLNRWKKKILFDNFYKPAVRNLLSTHAPVHLHPNSFSGTFRLGRIRLPRVVESTFVRRSELEESDSFAVIPNLLDIDFKSRQRIEIDFEALNQLNREF